MAELPVPEKKMRSSFGRAAVAGLVFGFAATGGVVAAAAIDRMQAPDDGSVEEELIPVGSSISVIDEPTGRASGLGLTDADEIEMARSWLGNDGTDARLAYDDGGLRVYLANGQDGRVCLVTNDEYSLTFNCLPRERSLAGQHRVILQPTQSPNDAVAIGVMPDEISVVAATGVGADMGENVWVARGGAVFRASVRLDGTAGQATIELPDRSPGGISEEPGDAAE